MVKISIPDFIAECCSLACLLEVSGYPKPGNIHRLRNSTSTVYEDFLAGSVAIYPAMRGAAFRGFNVGLGTLSLEGIEVGKFIKMAMEETLRRQSGGNINLGIILLFTPIAAAAGLCHA
ncbi:MAG: triphosphoribosyl-dephospho-CoA synthase, partial [Candidatus Odinarchaeia archaeon]